MLVMAYDILLLWLSSALWTIRLWIIINSKLWPAPGKPRRPRERVWNLKQNREDAGPPNLNLKGIRFEGRNGMIKS